MSTENPEGVRALGRSMCEGVSGNASFPPDQIAKGGQPGRVRELLEGSSQKVVRWRGGVNVISKGGNGDRKPSRTDNRRNCPPEPSNSPMPSTISVGWMAPRPSTTSSSGLDPPARRTP